MKKTLLIAAVTALLAMTVVAIGGGTVITQPSGSHLSGGTTDTLTKWTSSTTLGNSAITDFRASGVSVSIASTGKVSTGDTASTSVDNNVDVLTVANTGQANTTDGLKLLKLDGSTMTFDLASSKTNYGAYVDVRAPDVVGCGAPCTSQSGVMKNVGVFSNAQGGDVSHSFVAANGDAVFTDPVRIGGTVAGAYAADDGDEALILQPNATGLTFDYQAIYSAPVTTFNATAATRKSYGVYADNQSTRSAGGFLLWNAGVYGTASGGQINAGIWGESNVPGDMAGYFSGTGDLVVETANAIFSTATQFTGSPTTLNASLDAPSIFSSNTTIDPGSYTGSLDIGTGVQPGGSITIGGDVPASITVGKLLETTETLAFTTNTTATLGATTTLLALTHASDVNLRGITGGSAGRRLRLFNDSLAALFILNENLSATAVDRFKGPGSVTQWTLNAYETIDLVWSGSQSRWVLPRHLNAPSLSLDATLVVGTTATVNGNSQWGGTSSNLVGIGAAVDSNGPLSFAAAVGNKIQLYPIGATTQYGLGVQSNVMQLYAPTTTDRVALGYGDSDAFNERFSVSGTSIVSGSGNNTRTRVHGHLTSKMSGVPSPSSCGSSPSVNTNSTDNAGTFTTGSGASACTITFASSYSGGTVHCVITSTSASPGAPPTYTTSVSAISLSAVSASTSYSYICVCGDTSSGTCS